MALIQPPRSRAVIDDFGHQVTITIPPVRSLASCGTVLFLTVWMGGWALGEVTVARLLYKGVIGAEDAPQTAALAFMGLWFVLWTIGGVAAASTLVMNLFGRQRIIVDGQTLSVHNTPIGIKREYLCSQVRDLRVGSTASRVRGTGPQPAIAFDYGAKTVHFAQGLDEAELNGLVGLLAERFGGMIASAVGESAHSRWSRD